MTYIPEENVLHASAGRPLVLVSMILGLASIVLGPLTAIPGLVLGLRADDRSVARTVAISGNIFSGVLWLGVFPAILAVFSLGSSATELVDETGPTPYQLEFAIDEGTREMAQPSVSDKQVGWDDGVEAGREIARLERLLWDAHGEHKPFQLQGSITSRSRDQLVVYGLALPRFHDPTVLGSHWTESCLVVGSPVQGQIAYNSYSAVAYYLGEVSGTNAFGAEIGCSAYGPLPPSVERRVRQVQTRLMEAEKAFEEATAPARVELQLARDELESIRARIKRLEAERDAANSPDLPVELQGEGVPDIYSELRETLYPRQQRAQRRVSALEEYLDMLRRGQRSEPLSSVLALIDAESSTEERAQMDRKLADLEQARQHSLSEIERFEDQLAREEEIHRDNMNDMARSGSDTSRHVRAFEWSSARLQENIDHHRRIVAEIESSMSRLRKSF